MFPLTLTAPTLRRALMDFVTWQIGYSSGAAIYFIARGDDFVFGYGIYDRFGPGSRHAYELGAFFGAAMIRALTDGTVSPDEVMFCHDAPEDTSGYARMFKVPVRFNQNQCGMVISGRAIDHPLPTADPVTHKQARRAVGERARGGGRFPGRSPSACHPPADSESRSLDDRRGQGPQSSSAHAASSSRGGGPDLRKGPRRRPVRRRLRPPRPHRSPVGDISTTLAFATHSAFVAAFRRWSGMTPTAWRRSRA